jgi:cation diffusion facilitator CzcD-associated flavoprotein CzcO
MVKVYTSYFKADGSSWKLPDIPGLQKFKGDLFHTANWKENYSYEGKRVAVIGSGSSAIQVVPQLQPRTPLPYES